MLWLEVTAPICSFRVPWAREYAESYPVPPPSTVFGMLLSLVGEWNRTQYIGVELALAFAEIPAQSRLLRKIFRYKSKNLKAPCNSRPDYKVVVTGVHFWVGIKGKLSSTIANAFADPSTVNRANGLSLGENQDLIDSISIATEPPQNAIWLVKSNSGSLCLSYWADYTGKHSRFQHYSLIKNTSVPEPERIFTKIHTD